MSKYIIQAKHASSFSLCVRHLNLNIQTNGIMPFSKELTDEQYNYLKLHQMSNLKIVPVVNDKNKKVEQKVESPKVEISKPKEEPKIEVVEEEVEKKEFGGSSNVVAAEAIDHINSLDEISVIEDYIKGDDRKGVNKAASERIESLR